jgi:hypothetical protein
MIELEKLRDSQEAFRNAIKQGFDYHDYMYMYSKDGRDYFKHIDTREYVSYKY